MSKKELIDIESFESLDIRAGTIIDVTEFREAKKPAFKIWIDFGPEVNIKKSSAQITDLYSIHELMGRQIVALVNVKTRQIGPFTSEFLVLGLYNNQNEVVLIQPERKVQDGSKLG